MVTLKDILFLSSVEFLSLFGNDSVLGDLLSAIHFDQTNLSWVFPLSESYISTLKMSPVSARNHTLIPVFRQFQKTD